MNDNGSFSDRDSFLILRYLYIYNYQAKTIHLTTQETVLDWLQTQLLVFPFHISFVHTFLHYFFWFIYLYTLINLIFLSHDRSVEYSYFTELDIS